MVKQMILCLSKKDDSSNIVQPIQGFLSKCNISSEKYVLAHEGLLVEEGYKLSEFGLDKGGEI